MGEQIVEIFELFVRKSIVLIVNGCLNVWKEIFKFFLVLLIHYYFALWSFQILDELLLTAPVPSFGTEYGSEAHPVIDETFLRIGAPDEKLIQQRASLLEQLEIEAEFEENIRQLIKSENTLNNAEIRVSNDGTPLKDTFISQIKYDINETSRPSQTTKTSLGKKSKPKQDNIENGPQVNTTLIDGTENPELWQEMNSNREFDMDAVPTTSTAHEMPSPYVEQKKS